MSETSQENLNNSDVETIPDEQLQEKPLNLLSLRKQVNEKFDSIENQIAELMKNSHAPVDIAEVVKVETADLVKRVDLVLDSVEKELEQVHAAKEKDDLSVALVRLDRLEQIIFGV